MSVPTSYTDDEFGDYLEAELGPVATMLGWTRAGGQFAEPTNDALLELDLTETSSVSASQIQAFRTLGKLATWRRAQSSLGTVTDFSADGASFTHSQTVANAKAKIKSLEAQAEQFMSATAVITTQRIDRPDDPYKVVSLEDREQ